MTPRRNDHPRHHLVLLPLRTLTDERALEVVERLDAAGALEVVHAARIGPSGDGAVGAIDVVRRGEPPLDGAGWGWLLAAIIRTGLPTVGTPPVAGISPSFGAEVRAVLGAARRWLATVTGRVDPGLAVDELAGFPEARLVYGVLPEAALASARQAPGTTERRGRVSSRELTPR